VLDVIHEPRLNHRVEVMNGVLAEECGDLLKAFFRRKRREVEERAEPGHA
jgi:tRNA(adenine34) deaminase